jgi:hypothetical protein
MPDWIGWVATATFASSYFCKRPATLRRVQGLAAVLWMIYGVLIHALPVIVANAVVASLAIFSSFLPAGSGIAGLRRPRVAEPLPSDEG